MNMFKKQWLIARWSKDGQLNVLNERYWTRKTTQKTARRLNDTFSGLNGVAVALGGRLFFALKERDIEKLAGSRGVVKINEQ